MDKRFEIVGKYVLTGECGVLLVRDYELNRRLQIPIAIELYDGIEIGYKFGSVDRFIDELF